VTRRTTLYAAMTGGFGSLAQVLPILDRLDRSRFRIACSISHGAADALRRLGYELIPYPEVAPPRVVTPKGRRWFDLDHYWGRFGFADPEHFAALVESRLRIVRELEPDVLLTQFCPPTEAIARITGIPLVCITQSCWHPAGKRIDWWDPRRSDDYPRATPAVNAVLERHGAAPIRRMEDLNRGDLTLLPSFPEFDPVDDPAARYLGPLHWESAGRMDTAEPSRPPVVVYTGKLQDSAGDSGQLILERVVEALQGTPVDTMIATGLGQDEVDLRPYQRPNIRVRDWVPLDELLPHCRLFIHHGGHGSCMAAIQAGVPSLVIPTFQEREFNARQLHALGLGDFLTPEELTPGRLARKIADAVEDGASTRANLRRWRETLAARRYEGADLAIREIETIVQLRAD
jgi:UDP:flavonoid glycosyltransferase YjiC (YdhE family)